MRVASAGWSWPGRRGRDPDRGYRRVILAKLFTALISPLGTSLALGVLALGLSLGPWRQRWREWGAGLGVLALGWLWLWSLPLLRFGSS